MTKTTICTSIGLSLALLFSSCGGTKITTVVLPTELDETATEYLTASSLGVSKTHVEIPQKSPVEPLLNVMEYYRLKIEANIINVENADFPKDAEKNQHYPKSAVLEKDGLSHLQNEEERIRLVYEPSHANAEKEGTLKGYVKYPAVDVPLEIAELSKNISAYNALAAALSQVDKNVVAPPIDNSAVLAAMSRNEEKMERDLRFIAGRMLRD